MPVANRNAGVICPYSLEAFRAPRRGVISSITSQFSFVEGGIPSICYDPATFRRRENPMRRRDFLGAVMAPLVVQTLPLISQSSTVQPKGRIRQGVTRGVFARSA